MVQTCFFPWTLNLDIAIDLLRLRVHYSVEIKCYKSRIRIMSEKYVLNPLNKSSNHTLGRCSCHVEAHTELVFIHTFGKCYNSFSTKYFEMYLLFKYPFINLLHISGLVRVKHFLHLLLQNLTDFLSGIS